MPEFGEIITNRLTINGSVPKNISEEMKENLKKLNELIKTRKFSLALNFIDDLLYDLKKENDFENFPLEFEDDFQKALYLKRHPDYEYQEVEIPIKTLLYHKGSLLIDLNYPEQAKDVLKQAWNYAPYSSITAIEYIESLKMNKEFDKAEETILKALNFTLPDQFIARLFRDLAFINTERGDFYIAERFYLLSLYYEENPIALQEIAYITKLNGGYPEETKENHQRFIDYIENKGVNILPQDTLLFELDDSIGN